MNHSALLRGLCILAVACIIPACGGSGGGTVQAPAAPAIPFVIPTGSGRTITARGGTGTTANGGVGGVIDIQHITGGNCSVLRDGSVDTAFAIPNDDISLGSNPRIVSVSTIFTVGGELGDGSAVILGDNAPTPATGLRVNAGVTLTIRPNFPAAGPYTNTQLLFQDGVLIEGNVVMARQDLAVANDGLSPNAAAFILQAGGGIVVRSTGSVTATGAVGAGTAGGNGGTIALQATGAVLNRGPITVSGGAGTIGGNGGLVDLGSLLWGVYNTGALVTSGGAGSAGGGGIGGAVQLRNSFNGGGSFLGGGCFNSGNITTTGGNGTTGGGNGGAVLKNNAGLTEDGPTVWSGITTASGGDGTQPGAFGGLGGAIQIVSRGGHLRVGGTLTSRGGNGNGFNGGNGGAILLAADKVAAQPVTGGVFIGATINTTGGDGTAGGSAGSVNVYNNAAFGGPFALEGQDPTVLVGYATFDASGGSGAVNGGAGNFARVTGLPAGSQSDLGSNSQEEFLHGSVLNEVDFITAGGAGTTGAGGNGGFAVVENNPNTPQTRLNPDFNRTVINRGAMDMRGGNGGDGGGIGGFYFQYDLFHVENTGSINSAGGSSGGATAGGSAGGIYVQSDGITVNSAPLIATGGPCSGAGTGGNAGQVIVDGQTTTCNSTISCWGGNSTGGTGGNSSDVEIGSWNGVTLTSLTGSANVSAGTGVTPGVTGIVTVDGIRRALIAGVVTF